MATIERYDTKSGRRYRVRYRKPDGRQTDKRGFTTKKAAEAFAATVEVDKLTGSYVAPSLGREPLDAVAGRWFARKVWKKPSWKSRQESILRVQIAPVWGSRAIASITKPEIRDWIADLSGVLSASTISDVHGVLAAVLDTAVEERLIASNPARKVELPKRELVEHNYLTHLQVRQLAREVSQRPEVVLILAYTGIRRGDGCAAAT
ncbi:phage integrase central domain-containing protein [Gordonia sp. FQ]|uniref:phage integrase central domain-containing protein n=1 Tax=Gordonia sp. FQ TaxID=3446634 RepID=UPI003F8746AB